MPQLSLIDADAPWSMSLNLRADPLKPEAGTVVTVATYNLKQRVLSADSRRFYGAGCDFLGDVAEACVNAYLYGNRHNDPGRVLARMAREAIVYAEAHQPGVR